MRMFKFLKQDKDGKLVDFFIDYVTQKNKLTDFALEVGINKIADVISKLHFDLYIHSTDQKEISLMDYRLNVKPNANQTATDFWKQAIYRMIKNPEGCVLINTHSNGIFIADSWQTDNSVQKSKIYSNIYLIVDDDTMSLNHTYNAEDVVHLRYSNPKLLRYLEQINTLNAQGWNVALNGFKAKAPKVKVSVPTSLKLQNEDGTPKTTNKYAEEIAEKLSSDEIKAIVSSGGIDISMIDAKNALTSNDIKALKDEVFTNTAIALGIPKSVFYGEVSEKSDANNEFITYACEPVIEIINNAVNGSWLSQDEYFRGDRILLNTSRVKHIDVIENAGGLDKLYQNGWSHNDILKLLGIPKVDEDWADERRFTKNYSSELKGGEE